MPSSGQEDLWGQTLSFVLGWIRTHRDDKFLPSIGKIDRKTNALSSAWKNRRSGWSRKETGARPVPSILCMSIALFTFLSPMEWPLLSSPAQEFELHPTGMRGPWKCIELGFG